MSKTSSNRDKQPANSFTLCRFRTQVCSLLKGSVAAVVFFTSFNVGKFAAEDSPRTIIADVLRHRSELLSGSFIATGTETLTNVRGQNDNPVRHTCEVRCDFDHLNGLLRSETRGERMTYVGGPPTSFGKTSNPPAQGLTTRIRHVNSFFVQTRDASACWSSVGNPSDDDHGTSPILITSPPPIRLNHLSAMFNPSLAGVLTKTDLHRWVKLEDRILAFADASVSVVEEEDKKVRLQLDRPYGADGRVIRETIVINREQGETIESYRKIETDAEGVELAWPVVTSAAEWHEREGIWIPVKVTTSYASTAEREHQHEFQLNWTSVNPQDLNPNEFSFRSFKGIWEETEVFDTRSGRLKLLGNYDAHSDFIPQPSP